MIRLGIVLAATLLVCGCSTDGFKKEVSLRESFGSHGTGQKYEVKWYRK
jgi:hypothetical protein